MTRIITKLHRGKRKTYYCSFNDKWTSEYDWVRKESGFVAFCKWCNLTFTVKHDGKKALSRHAISTKHQSFASAKSKNEMMEKFFSKVNSSEQEQVAAVELANIFHSVVRHHSYNSLDCGIKLMCNCFNDCKLSTKIHCGQTKAEAVVKKCFDAFCCQRSFC